MLQLIVTLRVLAAAHGDRLRSRLRAAAGNDRGQSTAEYALVLLGAASVALLLVAWATNPSELVETSSGPR